MTDDELMRLQPGDVVQHVSSGNAYVCIAGGDGRNSWPVVVRSLRIMNGIEWELVGIVSYGKKVTKGEKNGG